MDLHLVVNGLGRFSSRGEGERDAILAAGVEDQSPRAARIDLGRQRGLGGEPHEAEEVEQARLARRVRADDHGQVAQIPGEADERAIAGNLDPAESDPREVDGRRRGLRRSQVRVDAVDVEQALEINMTARQSCAVRDRRGDEPRGDEEPEGHVHVGDEIILAGHLQAAM